MSASRAKMVTFSAVAAGIVVLGAMALVEKDRVVEQWYLYKFARGDRDGHVYEGLAKFGGESALFTLIEHELVPDERYQFVQSIYHPFDTYTDRTGGMAPPDLRDEKALEAEARISERLGPVHLEVLAQYVADPRRNAKTRLGCASRIISSNWRGRFGAYPEETLAAISACIDLLASDQDRIRRHAEALFEICKDQANLIVPSLEKALDDPRKAVRDRAQLAVRLIRQRPTPH
jgi:hypothetical protein